MQRLATIGGQTGQIAHELNNTLTSLLGWAQQGLKAGEDTERANKALRQVVISAERAAEICRRLLGLSRRQRDSSEMVRINEIIKETADSLAGRLRKERISLDWQCSDDLEVYGSRVELVQVLLNILINSCQAMAQSGGKIRLMAEKDEHTDCARITITDSGPGISAENIRQIFEPFFSTRGSADTTGQIGTGLGLAICRDIVTAHGGFIDVQSVEGQGASFKILLHGKPT